MQNCREWKDSHRRERGEDQYEHRRDDDRERHRRDKGTICLYMPLRLILFFAGEF